MTTSLKTDQRLTVNVVKQLFPQTCSLLRIPTIQYTVQYTVYIILLLCLPLLLTGKLCILQRNSTVLTFSVERVRFHGACATTDCSEWVSSTVGLRGWQRPRRIGCGRRYRRVSPWSKHFGRDSPPRCPLASGKSFLEGRTQVWRPPKQSYVKWETTICFKKQHLLS